VDQVAEAIAEINGLVSKVNGLMNAVVTAGADQSSGIAQVGRSIQELEHATRRNASLLERMETLRLESR
jgi:methyl-accepting chemotaxis protein